VRALAARGRLAALGLAAWFWLLVACGPGTGTGVVGTGPGAADAGAPAAAGVATPRPQYVDLVDAVADTGSRVWVEADLVKAWLAGPQRFSRALDVVVALALRPGVDGVKVADELGYGDGLTSPAKARAFLQAAGDAIHGRLPHTKVLVDMIVPELGCNAWVRRDPGRDACAAAADRRDPAATLAAVGTYLPLHAIDVLDLSVGLRDEQEYASWGTTRDDAMREAWSEVVRRGWGGMVTLQARKALAHPGAYTGGAAGAQRDLRTFVDIPLAAGAAGVDIWTWSQTYQGQTVRLTDPGMRPNALVAGLRARRQAGARLWTHMSPSSLQQDQSGDVAAATAIFGAVFVAAGTG